MGKKDFSQLSREQLLTLIDEIRSKKKYGLVWDVESTKEHFEINSQDSIPILEEDKEKQIVTDCNKPINILIEGDNYHSLTVLYYSHKEKVDLIYIDPPYNTCSKDFKYNDKYIDKNDTYRHSKWLSFISKRLKLARELLKNSGVIFISINEDEVAQLKILCDQLFGLTNYLTMFTVKVRHEDRILKGDKDFHEVVEYLLLYRKSPEFTTVKRVQDNSSLKDYVFAVQELTTNPKVITMAGKQVKVFKPDEYKIVRLEANENHLKKINIRGSIKEGNSSGRFYMRYLDQFKDSHALLFKVPDMGDDALGYRYFLTPTSERKINGDYFQGVPTDRLDTKEVPYSNYLDFETKFNNVGYEGGVEFRNGKKPVDFILKLLEIGGLPEDGIVLDFFAGSGSTGQAVFELNHRDRTQRQVILCTNNENNICREVTYPRLVNVIKGYSYRGKESRALYEQKLTTKNIVNAANYFEEAQEILQFEKNNYDNIDIVIEGNSLKVIGIKRFFGFRPGIGGNIKYFKTKFMKKCDSQELNADDFLGGEDVPVKSIPQFILERYKEVEKIIKATTEEELVGMDNEKDKDKEINEILNILAMGPQFKKVQALKRLGDQAGDQYIEIFRKYLGDKDWHLRLEAAWGLGKLLGQEALDELTPLLKDKAYGVREDVKKVIDRYCS